MRDAAGGFVVVFSWCILMVVIGLLVNLFTGCAGDGMREKSQRCGGTHHMVCEGDLNCEYEFYKECINE